MRKPVLSSTDPLHHVDNLVQLAISGAMQLPVMGCFDFWQVTKAIRACAEPSPAPMKAKARRTS